MPTTHEEKAHKNVMETYKFETPISLAYPCFFNYEVDVGFRDRRQDDCEYQKIIPVRRIPIVKDVRMRSGCGEPK